MQHLLRIRLFGYLFVLGFFAVPAAAQTASTDTLWAESWEGAWTNDWFVDAGTWEVGTPTNVPNGAYAGSNAAATVLNGNYAGNVDSRLISPPFIVPAASENPRLSFWHWFGFSGGDFGEVQISSDGGSTWQTISPTYIGTGSGVWTYPMLDLSFYAGSTVQLAFYFHSDGGPTHRGWYIDEVTIFCGNTPCDENDIVIPVELAEFNARIDGADVLLQWRTLSETNNSGFEVQHAEAEAAWAPVGWVQGYGTTTETQTYAFRLEDLAPGTHRFRLKQVDFDGAFEYSPEVEVEIGVPEAFVLSHVYPNPVNPEARFTLALQQTQPVRLTVYDVLGRAVAVVHEGELAGGTTHPFTLRADAWPSGLYVLRAAGETFTTSRSFVVVK